MQVTTSTQPRRQSRAVAWLLRFFMELAVALGGRAEPNVFLFTTSRRSVLTPISFDLFCHCNLPKHDMRVWGEQVVDAADEGSPCTVDYCSDRATVLKWFFSPENSGWAVAHPVTQLAPPLDTWVVTMSKTLKLKSTSVQLMCQQMGQPAFVLSFSKHALFKRLIAHLLVLLIRWMERWIY
jgi:hypothetical protein